MLTTAQREEFDTARRVPASNDTSPKNTDADKNDAGWRIALVAIFVFAVLLRLSFNLWLPHVNNFAACDAFEYLQNARALLALGSAPGAVVQKIPLVAVGAADPATSQAVHTALSGMKDFAISGPTFPLYLAITLVLGGAASLPDYVAWQALLTWQSIMSALTCIFIALTARECFSRRSGIVAGVFAAIYPGFIIASGRLYSESFACTILAVISWLVVRGFRTAGNALPWVFLNGMLLGGLQLARSVMAALSLAMVPLTILQRLRVPAGDGSNEYRKSRGSALRNVIAALTTLCVGFAIPAVPWLAFQKAAFGGGGLVVDRVGRYNFFIGNNVDTAGWLSYPYPDGRGVEAKSFPVLLSEGVRRSPERWLKLMLDKPGRLFKFPWNDFKTTIGPLNHAGQVFIHQLILMLAASGVAFGLFRRRPDALDMKPTWRDLHASERARILSRVFLLGLFSFHCIYYLFITVPRYNLTAIPSLIVFSAGGLSILVEMLRTKATRSSTLALLGFCVGLAALLWTPQVALLCDIFPEMSPNTVLAVSCVLKGLSLFAITNVARSLLSRTSCIKRPARILATALSIALAPVLCFPVRANGRWYEWCTDLSVSRGTITQVIKLPKEDARLRERDAYLIFDAEGIRQFSDGLTLRVNGVSLKAPFIPGMSLAESFERSIEISPKVFQREGERQWDSLTAGVGIGNNDLRQWTIVPLPAQLLVAACDRADEQHSDYAELKVELNNSSARPLKVFGSYAHNKDRALPSADTYSWEKCFYGVENGSGLTDTRYDIKAPADQVQWSSTDLSEQAGLQTGAFNMAVLLAPPVPVPVAAAVGAPKSSQQSKNDQTASENNSHKPGDSSVFRFAALSSSPLPATRISSKDTGLAHVQVKAPLNASANIFQPVYLVRLRGKIMADSADIAGAVSLCSLHAKGGAMQYQIYRSPWTPPVLPCSANWKDFEVVVPLPSSLNGAPSDQISVLFSCSSPDIGVRNIYRKINGTVYFTDLHLDVFCLPTNPVGVGHLLY